MGFKGKKFLLTFSFISVVALLLPLSQANAQAQFAEDVFNWLVGGVLKVVLGVSQLAMVAASEILGWVASENFIAWSYTGVNAPNPIVTAGWTIIRDLCNTFFVVILAFIGLATALKIEKYRYEKLLPTLLLVAIAINFTPVLCGIFIDASNILMNFFLGRFSGLRRAVQEFTRLTSTISETFSVGKSLTDKGSIIIHILAVSGFNILLALILFLFAFLFIARYAILWFLVIISPLALFSLILPDTKRYFNKWLTSFLQWCFIGVTAGFFLYLGDQILTQTGSMVAAVPPEMGELEASFAGLIQTIVPYGAALVFTWMGFTSALGSSAVGANIAIRAARWTAGRARAGAAAVGGSVLGATGLAARGLQEGAKGMQHQVTDKVRLNAKTGEFYQGMAKASGKGFGKGAFAGWANASRSERAGMFIGGISSLAGKGIARAGLKGRAEAQQRMEAKKSELKKTYGNDWQRAVTEAGMISKAGTWDERIEMAEYIKEVGGAKGLKKLDETYPEFLGGAIKEMDKYAPDLIKNYATLRPELIAQKDKAAIARINGNRRMTEEQKKLAIGALPYTPTAMLVQRNIVKGKEEDVQKLVDKGYSRAEAVVESAFNQAVDSMKTSDLGDMSDEALKDPMIMKAIARRKSPDFIKKIFEEKSSEVSDGLAKALNDFGAYAMRKEKPGFARRFSSDSALQAMVSVEGLNSKEDYNFLNDNWGLIGAGGSPLDSQIATLEGKALSLGNDPEAKKVKREIELLKLYRQQRNDYEPRPASAGPSGGPSSGGRRSGGRRSGGGGTPAPSGRRSGGGGTPAPSGRRSGGGGTPAPSGRRSGGGTSGSGAPSGRRSSGRSASGRRTSGGGAPPPPSAPTPAPTPRPRGRTPRGGGTSGSGAPSGRKTSGGGAAAPTPSPAPSPTPTTVPASRRSQINDYLNMDDQSFNRLYNERMADLNITLGAATPEEIEETKELQEELVALHETKRYRESIAGAAQSFAIRHETDIEKELKGGKGRSLKNIFYDDFYANNIDNLAYQEGSPEVARLKTDYDKSVETAKDRLQKAAEAGREIRVIPQRGWVFAQANKGLNRKEKIGRFYLNLKPEHTGDFFAQAAEEFGNAGLNVDMKIAETGNAGSFNRPDKMVIYFNEAEEQQAIQALEKLHHRNQQMFETGRPRFAARVSDSSGREMPGLGFGEEPSVAGGKSFGEVRTEILAEVYSDAKLSGSSVSDPDFDFEASFRKACRMYNVDPANTAFNLSTPSSEFSELRRRAA